MGGTVAWFISLWQGELFFHLKLDSRSNKEINNNKKNNNNNNSNNNNNNNPWIALVALNTYTPIHPCVIPAQTRLRAQWFFKGMIFTTNLIYTCIQQPEFSEASWKGRETFAILNQVHFTFFINKPLRGGPLFLAQCLEQIGVSSHGIALKRRSSQYFFPFALRKGRRWARFLLHGFHPSFSLAINTRWIISKYVRFLCSLQPSCTIS